MYTDNGRDCGTERNARGFSGEGKNKGAGSCRDTGGEASIHLKILMHPLHGYYALAHTRRCFGPCTFCLRLLYLEHNSITYTCMYIHSLALSHTVYSLGSRLTYCQHHAQGSPHEYCLVKPYIAEVNYNLIEYLAMHVRCHMVSVYTLLLHANGTR